MPKKMITQGDERFRFASKHRKKHTAKRAADQLRRKKRRKARIKHYGNKYYVYQGKKLKRKGGK